MVQKLRMRKTSFINRFDNKQDGNSYKNAAYFYKADEVYASLREVHASMTEWVSPTSMKLWNILLNITEQIKRHVVRG